MRQILTIEPHKMELREVPDPIAGPGEAVVRIERVGLCGSDYHLFVGHHPYATYPQTQGHELAGIIESFGPGYDGPLAEGVRVAIEPLLPCGACFACRRGRRNCCSSLRVLGAHVPGGLVDRLAVPVSSLYPVGDLDPELAALCEPISIGVQAVARGGVETGDDVVVLGAGPIGQAALLSAKDRGARVLVADLLPERLDVARRLGADRVVDSGKVDLAVELDAWTEGAAVVIEATGAPAVVRLGVELTAPSGTLVIVGLSQEEVSLPILEFTRKELSVLGSRNNAGRFGDAVELVRRTRERVRALITHRHSLEETPAAIAFAVEHPQEVEKVMIEVAG